MKDISVKIPNGAQKIIDKLSERGFRADIVGGCVRDALLGKTANDFDITTSASPEEMLEVFRGFRVIETGLKHGTLTVISDGEPYEVTTYRIDGEYSDSRHPDSVTFTRSIEEDLSRRDFTVNAMAYSEKYGLTDLFFGKKDVEEKIIRAVGNPEKRFCEDALRILRALRFSSVLSFSVEEETAEAARRCKSLLLNVSEERIYSEWKKLIAGKGAYDVISAFPDIISVILPELEGYRLPERGLFDEASGAVRFICLFSLNVKDGAPQSFERACKRLKTDRKTREDGTLVLENISAPLDTKAGILRILSKIGEERTALLINTRIALGASDKRAEQLLKTAVSDGSVYKISDLAIDGRDLMEKGFSGEEIGRKLSALLDLVIDGEAENKREELLDKLSKE